MESKFSRLEGQNGPKEDDLRQRRQKEIGRKYTFEGHAFHPQFRNADVQKWVNECGAYGTPGYGGEQQNTPTRTLEHERGETDLCEDYNHEAKIRLIFEEKAKNDFQVYEVIAQRRFEKSFERHKAKEQTALEELRHLAENLLTKLKTDRDNNPDKTTIARIHNQLEYIYSSTLKSLDNIKSAEDGYVNRSEAEIMSTLARPFTYSNSSEELHSLIREQREKIIDASSQRLSSIETALFYVRSIKSKN